MRKEECCTSAEDMVRDVVSRKHEGAVWVSNGLDQMAIPNQG